MQINCCKDCENRHLGCHDSCTIYHERLREYHAEQQAIKDMYSCARSARTVALANKGVIARYK